MLSLLGKSRRAMARMILVIAAAFCAASVSLSQTPAGQPPPGGQQGRGGRGGRGGGRPAPVPDDMAGFESIFDGKTMNNWDGDPTYWRAEEGALVGESTPEKPVKQNTFVIWRGGTPKDFELKLEFRINSTNSGIQYRSVALPDVGQWVLKGYQADIDIANNFTGMLYEERGRGFLAPRGQFNRLAAGRVVKAVGSLGDSEAMKAHIKVNDWNLFHIIARGNTLIHVMNGVVMSILIDEDQEGRAMEGLLGMQMHVGPPMKVEFRNILLRRL